MSAETLSFETVRVEIRDRVGLITLDRPKALNALSARLLADLTDAVAALDADDGIGALVLTGSEKAFAAGADIKEMASLDFTTAFRGDLMAAWERFTAARKPILAAVSGYALGGGCELAMMCDLIYAAETAKFGQPEITLGIIPGIGGTQRLIRAVGKAKAMDLILTGRMMDAAEAERSGLVARVLPAESLLEETLAAAARIAGFSPTAVMMAKEAVNRAPETTLAEGLRYERRLFHALFSTEDQKEGMAAFIEKRPPVFTGR
ncbi:enoyl-CoA hydratase [Mongoliimonas terrestris]|uniref:enoyl-CoA hydratase n=1 Tax=Mongoliimonas terrestris TaxID=1709001 RepID=UPI00094992E6|nr:enoyl-CoA hydratase [Mongoliimonas terrestris]